MFKLRSLALPLACGVAGYYLGKRLHASQISGSPRGDEDRGSVANTGAPALVTLGVPHRLPDDVGLSRK